MKTKFALSFYLFILILFPAFSQQYKLYPGQEILFPGSYTEMYYDGIPKADIIAWQPYDLDGNLLKNRFEHFGGRQERIHSENGLQDTVFHKSGIIRTYAYDYFTDGKIKSRKHINYYTPGVHYEHHYEYDTKNRLTLHNYMSYNREIITKYDYKENTITQTEKNMQTNKTTVTITFISFIGNGYIAETNGEKVEYLFDENKRPVKAGNILYEYFDGGYRKIDYSNTTAPRTDYYYNQNGYLSQTIEYIMSGDDWVHDATYIYTYTGGDFTTSLVNIEKSHHVYGGKGTLVVETEKPLLVCIYLLNGKLIKKEKISSPHNMLPLPSGIYIVIIGNETYKVIIN